MQELLKNAYQGLLDYTGSGKFAVVLAGILLYVWFIRKTAVKGKGCRLIEYASLITVMVAIPFTAVFLMLYQTRFYDYKWLWSLVPLSLIMAYGLVLIGDDIYHRKGQGHKWKTAGYAVLGLALLVLCGNLSGSGPVNAKTAGEWENNAALLEYLTGNGNTDNICLWGPRSIMEQARSASGRIMLPYGRNMWEASLNAYSYDTYTSEKVSLYEWMESLEDEDTVINPEVASVYLEAALDLGVNCILIPDTVSEETIGTLRNLFDEKKTVRAEEEMLGGYHIFHIYGE